MAPKKTKVHKFPHPMETLGFVGHENIRNAFIDAWNNRDKYPLHPVWMLTGTRGIGKATLAYHIARFVFRNAISATDADMGPGLFDEPETNNSTQDTNLITNDRFDTVYQKMLDGGFGDFYVIDMARNIDKDGRSKPDGKIISAFTVRAMIERMQMSTMEGGWRVVIVDSMDELNEYASNALLKVLEEPPSNTLFLLIAHSLSRTLPTIRSRARVEKMTPLSVPELRQLFYKMIPDEDVSPALLKLANGSFGRIADLKRDGGDALYEDLLNIIENQSADSSHVMAIAGRLAREPSLYGILLDAAAHYGLADLYPKIARDLDAVTGVHLNEEVALFKIITNIKKARWCL